MELRSALNRLVPKDRTLAPPPQQPKRHEVVLLI